MLSRIFQTECLCFHNVSYKTFHMTGSTIESGSSSCTHTSGASVLTPKELCHLVRFWCATMQLQSTFFLKAVLRKLVLCQARRSSALLNTTHLGAHCCVAPQNRTGGKTRQPHYVMPKFVPCSITRECVQVARTGKNGCWLHGQSILSVCELTARGFG